MYRVSYFKCYIFIEERLYEKKARLVDEKIGGSHFSNRSFLKVKKNEKCPKSNLKKHKNKNS